MPTGGLPERELQGLLEILGEVHHAEDLPSFRAALLDVLPRVIPNAYTSYNEILADVRTGAMVRSTAARRSVRGGPPAMPGRGRRLRR